MVITGSIKQSCHTIDVLSIDISVIPRQLFRSVQISLLGGVVQRRTTEPVLRVDHGNYLR
jgi:hypothetical protein